MLLAGIFAGWIQRLQPFLRRCSRRALSLSQNRDSILAVARQGELNRVLLRCALPPATPSFTSYGCELLCSEPYRASVCPSSICALSFLQELIISGSNLHCSKVRFCVSTGAQVRLALRQTCLWQCVSTGPVQNGLWCVTM